MGWKVEYKPEVAKQLAEQLRAGQLTPADLAALKSWVSAIENRGLSAVQTVKWHDHPLEAEWKGYRAAAFSDAGRVIYKVENGKLIVWVIRVTATHDYRR